MKIIHNKNVEIANDNGVITSIKISRGVTESRHERARTYKQTQHKNFSSSHTKDDCNVSCSPLM